MNKVCAALMLESFVKTAKDYLKPASPSDAMKGMKKRDVGKDRQTYSQPNAAQPVVRLDLISAQKSIPPPPVL